MARVIQTNLDLSKNQLMRARIENLASDPASPVLGQIYYNTANNQLNVYTGAAFSPVATGTTPQATSGAVGTVQLTNDFGGTATAPTVVATHLASALPVNQGGSGAGTFTSGNVLVGAGTGAFTATLAAPSSAFVGITDAQTLTNKTLTTPTINGASLSGTLSGTPTFSGAITFSAVPQFNAGIASAAGTITTNNPSLSATQTWNAAGVSFQGISLNVTNTASAAGARLIDLGTGGGTYASMFSVDTTGNVRIGGNYIGNLTGNVSGTAANVTGTVAVGNGGTGATSLTGVIIGNGTSAFTTKSNPTGAFVGDSDTQTLTSKTLTTPTINGASTSGTWSGTPTFSGNVTHTSTVTSTIGSVAVNTPSLTATQTWNAAGVSFQGLFLNITNTASAAGSRLADLQVGGVSQFSVDTAGAVRGTSFIGPLTGNVTGNISGTAANVTGTVAPANGGTGATTVPANGTLLVGNGSTYTNASLASSGSTITYTAGTGTLNLDVNGTNVALISGGSNSSITALTGIANINTTAAVNFGGTLAAVAAQYGVVHNNTHALTATVTSASDVVINAGTYTGSAAVFAAPSTSVSGFSRFYVAQATLLTANGSAANAYGAYINAPTGTGITTAWAAGFAGNISVTGSIVAPNIGPSAGQQHTLPAVTSDTLALLAATQTFTNKTLTAPVLGGSVTGTYTLAGTPTLSGTFAGTPTFSGVVTFSSQPSITGTSSATFQFNSLAQIKAASTTELQVVSTDGTTLANMRVNNLYVNGELIEVTGSVVAIGDSFFRLNDQITTHTSNSNGGITVKRLSSTDTAVPVSSNWNEVTHRWEQDITSANGDTVYAAQTSSIYKTVPITGDGTTTSFAITHNLNNQWPVVQIVDNATNQMIETDVTYTSATVTTIGWAVAPANAATFKVLFNG